MKPMSYFELRCAVLETFYDVLVSEGYTIGQAAGRCLVEFRTEAQGGGQGALIVLATLLSRVARHDPEALARFAAEVGALRALGKKAACWRDLAAIEKERLQEDLRLTLERA